MGRSEYGIMRFYRESHSGTAMAEKSRSFYHTKKDAQEQIQSDSKRNGIRRMALRTDIENEIYMIRNVTILIVA